MNGAWNETKHASKEECFAKCGLSIDELGINSDESILACDTSADENDWDDDDDDDISVCVIKMAHDLFGCDF